MTLAGSGTDPEGGDLTYLWSQTSGTTVSLNDATVVGPAFTAPDLTGNEDLVFSLTVTDDQMATGTDSVTITVQANNDPPTASAGADQSATEGATVTLAGSGTDPEGAEH